MSTMQAADDVVASFATVGAGDRPPLLVLEPLAAFLDEQGMGTGPLTVEPIGEGHSNVTYLLRRAGAGDLVLRRPPRPPIPPSAHDVIREAKLLAALQSTPVPAPRVLATCADETVIGAPFYLMERIAGEVIVERLPAALDSPAERRRISEALIEALVSIHEVDWRAAGLEGFGKPTGYLERQLRRFGGLWEINRTRDIPAMETVEAWLRANLPESPAATIVHGDYRLGNTIFAPSAPAKLLAVLDWEMATIGDPLADLGYLCMMWSDQSDPEGGLRTHLGAVTRAAGFMSRAQLIDRYADLSGRPVGDLRWYVALALWKAAVFMEGNYKRAVAGTTDDPYLKAFGAGVLELAEQAQAVSNGS